jgi:putative transposase
MNGYTFSTGQHLLLDGEACEVERINQDDTRQISIKATGSSRPMTIDQLLAAYAEDRLSFIPTLQALPLENAEARTARLDRDLSALDDERKAATERRIAYVRAIQDSEVSLTEPAVSVVVGQVSTGTEDPAPPSARSVIRWFKEFREAGFDMRGLITLDNRSGNKTQRYPAMVYEIAEQAINEIYLTPNKGSIEATWAELMGRIGRYNLLHPGAELPAVSQKLIRRMVAEIPPFDVCAARHGRLRAEMKFRSVIGTISTSRIGQRYELDHTLTDMIAVDDASGLPLGRAWMTALIDAHSKCLVGYYIGFEPPSDASVINCFKHAFLGKQFPSVSSPTAQHRWVAYGLPEEIVTDNDRTHHGAAVIDACNSLGITLTYCKVKKPWQKPHIERFFKSLAQNLLHEQQGTTFSNIFDKGDYDPVKHAVIPMSVLIEAFEMWVTDVYSFKINRRTASSPHQNWVESVRQFPPRLPPSAAALDAFIGKVTTRTLGHEGVQIDNVLYNDQETGERLRRLHGERFVVRVKYNPSDLGHVYILDPDTNHWELVPAVNQAYAVGLSVFQHRVISRFKRAMALTHAPIEDWCEAKLRVRDVIREGLHGRGRRQIQKSALRFMAYGKERPHDEIKLGTAIIAETSAPAREILMWDEKDVAPEAPVGATTVSVEEAEAKPAKASARRGRPKKSVLPVIVEETQAQIVPPAARIPPPTERKSRVFTL